MDNDVTVPNSEDVARILSTEWIVDGKLSNVAFTLRPHETYISVNRPAISSYNNDVASFVEAHPSFLWDAEKKLYSCALLHVADIRNIQVGDDETDLKIDVEIEPRDMFTKSHAGIFTRHNDKNIKPGDVLPVLGQEYSVDDVLLEVRTQLMRLAAIEVQPISKG